MSPPPDTALTFTADHPVFAGHFPGTPLVPGALLLDEVARRIEPAPTATLTFSRVKFRRAVLPGVALWLELTPRPEGSQAFVLRDDSGAVTVDGVVSTRA